MPTEQTDQATSPWGFMAPEDIAAYQKAGVTEPKWQSFMSLQNAQLGQIGGGADQVSSGIAQANPEQGPNEGNEQAFLEKVRAAGAPAGTYALWTPTKGNGYMLQAFGPDGKPLKGMALQMAADASPNFIRDAVLLMAAGYAGGSALASAGSGAGAGAGAGAAGAGEVSGMDLAADAALGSGNNVVTAGSGLGAGGGGGLLSSGEALGGSGDAAGGEGLLGSGEGATSFHAADNYGPGLSGAETSTYDGVIGSTGSPQLAAAANGEFGPALGSAWDWLAGSGSTVQAGGSLFNNPLFATLIGHGVAQYSNERQAQENREFVAAQDAARRGRQAPVGMLGAHLNVKKGTPNAAAAR